MNVLNKYVVDPIKNHYVDFSGRATRTQFWLFALFCVILLAILRALLGSGLILALCVLALFLPNLAIAARRLRDGGFSPWLLLLSLIPFIGQLILLVLFLLPSKN